MSPWRNAVGKNLGESPWIGFTVPRHFPGSHNEVVQDCTLQRGSLPNLVQRLLLFRHSQNPLRSVGFWEIILERRHPSPRGIGGA